jgi:hypothetical protein
VTKLSSNSIKAAAGIAAGITLGVGAIGCPAKAVIITVSGTQYDVRTQTIDYVSDPTKFNVTDMPWWGNDPLALAFANVVRNSNPFTPPFPNTGGTFATDTSPLFAYSESAGVVNAYGSLNSGPPPNTLYSDSRASNLSLVYAYTVPITPPSSSNAPAPLPILGAAAAFAWGRKIRARLNTPTL